MPVPSTFRVLIPSDFRWPILLHLPDSRSSTDKGDATDVDIDPASEQGELYDLATMTIVDEGKTSSAVYPADREYADEVVEKEEDEKEWDSVKIELDEGERRGPKQDTTFPEIVPYCDSDYDCYIVQEEKEYPISSVAIIISDYDCEDEEERHSLLDLKEMSLAPSWPPKIEGSTSPANLANSIPCCNRGCLHVPRRGAIGRLDTRSLQCFICNRPEMVASPSSTIQPSQFPAGFGRSGSPSTSRSAQHQQPTPMIMGVRWGFEAYKRIIIERT